MAAPDLSYGNLVSAQARQAYRTQKAQPQTAFNEQNWSGLAAASSGAKAQVEAAQISAPYSLEATGTQAAGQIAGKALEATALLGQQAIVSGTDLKKAQMAVDLENAKRGDRKGYFLAATAGSLAQTFWPKAKLKDLPTRTDGIGFSQPGLSGLQPGTGTTGSSSGAGGGEQQGPAASTFTDATGQAYSWNGPAELGFNPYISDTNERLEGMVAKPLEGFDASSISKDVKFDAFNADFNSAAPLTGFTADLATAQPPPIQPPQPQQQPTTPVATATQAIEDERKRRGAVPPKGKPT